MAELAAVSSIIQIADVGLRLSVKLFAFAETVARADKAIVFTSKDVSLTSSVLKEVGEVLKKDQPSRTYSPEAIKTATAIVTECSEVFREMEKILVEKVPNISSNRGDRTSRTTVALERFKWPYWQPKLQLLRSNLDRLRSTLLVMLNVIIYQRLLTSEPAAVHASQTALIRDLINSKETQIRRYEKLKRSITDAKTPNPRSFSGSDKSPTLTDTQAVDAARELPFQVRKDQRRTPPIADLDQQEETNLQYLHHLMSLFDHLIMAVNSTGYQIGLRSRYRIRSHVDEARSSEINQLYHLHGKELIDQTLKNPVSNLNDHRMSADLPEGNIIERKRRREDQENSARVRKTRRGNQGSLSTRDPLKVSWIDGIRVRWEVLQRNICNFLGPEALARPVVSNGVPGYELMSVKPLMPEQLDDLVRMSEAYISESGVNTRPQDVYFTDSLTSQGQQMSTGAGYGPHSSSFFPNYAVPTQPAYSTEASFAPYPSAYPSGSSYQPCPVYPAMSAYPAAGHPASNRPSTAYSNYTHEDEYIDINSSLSYRQQPISQNARGYRDPGEVSSAYCTVDPEDTRIVLTDQRLELRVPRDPRLSSRDSRMNPREPTVDHRDTGLYTRPDPRSTPSYPSYVPSPGDVSMHGAVNVPRSNNYVASFAPGSGSSSPSELRGWQSHKSTQKRKQSPLPDISSSVDDAMPSGKVQSSSPSIHAPIPQHSASQTRPGPPIENSSTRDQNTNQSPGDPRGRPQPPRAGPQSPRGYPQPTVSCSSLGRPSSPRGRLQLLLRRALDPSEDDEHGEPASSAPSRKAYNNADRFESYDRPKIQSTNTPQSPYTLVPEGNLENDTQKQLDDLLALWTPLPQVGEEHS